MKRSATLWLVVLGSACAAEDETGHPSMALTSITVGASGETAEESGSTSSDPAQTTGNGGETSAASTTGGTDDGESGSSPKFDVPASETDAAECSDDDICCQLADGELPPHVLLEEFLAAYPPANMPQTHGAAHVFEPVAGKHMMAYSDLNGSDEIVDHNGDGATDKNLALGRSHSRAAAEESMPKGSLILEVREDPIEHVILGGPGHCDRVGWGWGSLLYEASDASIKELVYLYVGFCQGDDDFEGFYYSDEGAHICDPPG